MKVLQIQFIDCDWIFLLCVQRQIPTVQTVQQTVEILQVPLLDWFLTCPLLCMPRSSKSLSLTVQKAIVILQLQFIDKVFDVSVVQVQQVVGCRR